MTKRRPEKNSVRPARKSAQRRTVAAKTTSRESAIPARFDLRLLGPFHLGGPRGSIEFASKKLSGLFAFLACSAPIPQPRDRLITLLWGSHFDVQAKQNLRQALTRLRRLTDENIFASNDETVSIRPGAIACDVGRFEGLIHHASHESLVKAVELYKGGFLSDLSIKEDAWIEWASSQRRRLEGLALTALIRLGEEELQRNNPERSLEFSNRAVSIDNLREDAHRLIIRALSAAARKAEALAHYDHLAALLKRELNVTPDASTASLAAELRRGPSVSKPDPATAPLKDRPSIAVLPFSNMSEAPDQEYFADGVTEDILTALSKWRWFLVIARNSTFAFKGKSVSVKRLGEELGARYVLEGSIRKAGGRVRITAQLIEAATDRHIWASQYDREIGDIFAVQDEIAQQVVTAIDPAIRISELDRVRRKPPESFDGWDHFLRGSYYYHLLKKRDMVLAREHLTRAIEANPQFATAHARLATAHVVDASLNWSGTPHLSLAAAIQSARTAIALDPLDASAHAALAYALPYAGQHGEAIDAAHNAVELNSNYHLAYFALALALTFGGAPAEAIPAFESADRLNPRDPASWALLGCKAMAFYTAKQYEAANETADKALVVRPHFGAGLTMKIAALVRLGRKREAESLLLQVPPQARRQLPLNPFRDDADQEHILTALEEVGWRRDGA
jgi:TolB-like protein/Tfp pilus assembly protein PilF